MPMSLCNFAVQNLYYQLRLPPSQPLKPPVKAEAGAAKAAAGQAAAEAVVVVTDPEAAIVKQARSDQSEGKWTSYGF